MGLDLYIMKEGKAKQNKKGQWYWTVTKLCSLLNTWRFADELFLENCVTYSKTGKELWEAAMNIDEEEPEKQRVLDDLREYKIKNSDEISYMVEAWW